MFNSEEKPHKKRKMSASPLLFPLSSMPDDVVLNCLARVSKSDHAALSVTSKLNRSLVTSAALYKTRSLLGRTEPYVYVCLRTPPPNPDSRWYILRRRKIQNNSFDLIPIPSPPSMTPEASSVVVVDWGIYVIGGLIKGRTRTSDVWLLDCRTHTWSKVPSLGVARANAAAGVVDGKIYVLGGCYCFQGGSDWGEVFDPKTQTWEPLPPREGGNALIFHGSVVSNQKVYALDDFGKTLYYSPSQGEWGRGNRSLVKGWGRDWCMIDNLLFCLNANGTIFWCEPDELDWREPDGKMCSKVVMGLGFLEGSLSRSRLFHFDNHTVIQWEEYKIFLGTTQKLIDLLPGARLSNSGSNILLFWDVTERERLEIWCAEISLERRRQGAELWGIPKSINVVMVVEPFVDHYKVLHSASVTL